MAKEHDPISLQKETLRLVRELGVKVDDVIERLDRLEGDRVNMTKRVQAVEQHAAVFVENSATTNQRLDDIAVRLDRLERHPIR